MKRIMVVAVLAAVVGAGIASADPQGQQAAAPAQPKQSASDKTEVVIYPFSIWAPLLGISAKLPDLPELPSRPPGEGGGSSVSTDRSLNAAYGAGFEVESHKWLVAGQLVYAGLSGERSTPRTRATVDLTFGTIIGGRRIVGGLGAVAGVRRLALDIGLELGDLPRFGRKPGVWDPLIGADWRQRLGQKWMVRATFLGGGFGVGMDQDISFKAMLDWRIVKHVQLNAGWGLLHLKLTDGIGDRTFTMNQTLNGPQFGVGIAF